MAWVRVTLHGLSSFYDPSAASAWLSAARAVQWPSEYTAQVAALRRVWECLSYFVRSLNRPPLSLPDYREELLQAYGPMYQRDIVDARAGRFARTVTAPTTRAPRGWIREAMLPAIARDWGQALRPEQAGDISGAIVRASLASPSGTAQFYCLGGRDGGGESDCGWMGLYTGCASLIPSQRGCDPWTAESLAWWNPPGHDRAITQSACPPLVTSWSVAQRMIARFASQSPFQIVEDSQRFVLLANARTAMDAGVLPSQLFDYAQLAQTAASQGPSALRAAADRLGQAAAALALVPSGVSQVASLVLGLVQGISRVLPEASGTAVDDFGRATPVIERSTIETQVSGAPRWENPLPEGVAPGAGGGRGSIGGLFARLPGQAMPDVMMVPTEAYQPDLRVLNDPGAASMDLTPVANEYARVRNTLILGVGVVVILVLASRS